MVSLVDFLDCLVDNEYKERESEERKSLARREIVANQCQ